MSWLAILTFTFAGGCVSTQTLEQTNVRIPEGAKIVPDQPKDGPKRPPLPGTVVSLAIIIEKEAESVKDPAQKMKKYDDARRYFQDALQIDANYRDAVQGLARVYVRMEDFEHALNVYKKALEKTPKDHGMWFDCGMCYGRKKDLPSALTCFEKALELDPENRAYMKQLGFALARLGKTDEGLAYLTRAMGTAMAHYNMARMMEHLGRADECRRHLDIALQINPNLEQAREMLAGGDTARPSLQFQAD